MSVGLAISKSEIDARAGDIARACQKLSGDVLTMKSFLDQTADADLVALGYTDEEVADLKTAFADLYELWAGIWTGMQALAVAKDFRVFVRLLWGVGSF